MILYEDYRDKKKVYKFILLKKNNYTFYKNFYIILQKFILLNCYIFT